MLPGIWDPRTVLLKCLSVASKTAPQNCLMISSFSLQASCNSCRCLINQDQGIQSLHSGSPHTPGTAPLHPICFLSAVNSLFGLLHEDLGAQHAPNYSPFAFKESWEVYLLHTLFPDQLRETIKCPEMIY